MKKVRTFLFAVLMIALSASLIAQVSFERKVVKVPKVDPTLITLDGKMDEAAWQTAAQANLITSTGYEMFTNQYWREDLTEPDYDELYARMLWSQDTLYAFIHIDEVVNDSSNLFWQGRWSADQLFVSISSRLGIDFHPDGWWNGNVFTVPEGPYHFLILGDQLTLNNGEDASVPDEWQKFPGDTLRTGDDLDAYKFARMGAYIDTLTGIWDVELAIYNPAVAAQSALGFNIGGSSGSRYFYEKNGDGYAYWTWQPNVPDEPYTEPAIGQELINIAGYYDPGLTNLVTTTCHAILSFKKVGGTDVEDNYDPSIPAYFSLNQNYPNPFNPNTAIRFSVSKATPVTLKIYNSLGQLVTTLLDNQNVTTGSHVVTWNPKTISTGVYFYSLEAEGKVLTKKMILLK